MNTPAFPPPAAEEVRSFGPLAGVLTGVFLLKFMVVWQLHDHPLVQPDVGLDTTAYVELAKKVLAGNVGLGPGMYTSRRSIYMCWPRRTA